MPLGIFLSGSHVLSLTLSCVLKALFISVIIPAMTKAKSGRLDPDTIAALRRELARLLQSVNPCVRRFVSEIRERYPELRDDSEPRHSQAATGHLAPVRRGGAK